jgi:hypothetical protein
MLHAALHTNSVELNSAHKFYLKAKKIGTMTTREFGKRLATEGRAQKLAWGNMEI